MKDEIEKKVKKKVKREAKKQAKKAVKKHGKAIAITIAVIALVLIITIIALYVFKPELFSSIIDLIKGEQQATPEVTNPEDVPGITPITGEMLEMTVVDVGQGDGIVIEFPDGKIMVVDGGARFRTFSGKEIYDRMNAILLQTDKIKAGSHKIDYLMVTHADYDHLSSLPYIFENYEVENIYFPRIADINISNTWNKVYTTAKSETYLDENGNSVKSNYRENVGEFLISGKDWTMNCYSYKDADYPKVEEKSSSIIKNEISPICVLEYADRGIVLTGDATIETEEYLLGPNGGFKSVDVDVLKVGHHGSRGSTSIEFLNAIDAEYAIISCAETDYGHPHAELITRLNEYQDVTPDDDWIGFRELYVTKDDGNVVVQVGKDSTLNVISNKNETKNRTETKSKIVATVYEIKLYATITKEEDSEEQYTLNCA